MKKYYSYIRVSTARQGEGVSLIVQKEANERYAAQYDMQICEQMNEMETAAKQGRPVFNRMIKLLKQRKADGVIIHKIDRSARNFKDWGELSNLIDQGIEVHFSHESVDMQTRGGRLSANLQAVIAEDYIRNLRQEAIKGIYGRLEQGIYPFRAPVGYDDQGKAKPKTLNKLQAPLIQEAFELYATRKCTLNELANHMYTLGLRSVNNTKITANGFSLILNNTFYVGIITIKGQKFNGKHEPLITPDLFKRVQSILKGNTNQKILKHDVKFRKQVRCNVCGFALSAEIQKSNIYYRCHTRTCATNCIRESTLEAWILRIFNFISFCPSESEEINNMLKDTNDNWQKRQQDLVVAIRIQKGQLDKKIERLTDCYLDGGLDKETYQERKEKLLMEYKEKDAVERQLIQNQNTFLTKARNFFELATSLTATYKKGISEEIHDLIETVTSNFAVEAKKPVISMKSPFSKLYNRHLFISGGAKQDKLRQTYSECVITDINDVPETRKSLSREEIKLLFDEILLSISQLPEDNLDIKYDLSEHNSSA